MHQPTLPEKNRTIPPSLSWKMDDEGLAWVLFDAPGSPANIFTPHSLDELARLLDELAASKPRAAILLSGKKTVFVAGADLKWLAQSSDALAA